MLKILILILIIACIAPFFIKGPDNEPVMTLDDWKPSMPESISDLVPQLVPASPESGPSAPAAVYKWQDDEGQWHFSSVPPDLESAELIDVSSDINIMDPFVPPEVTDEASPVASGASLGTLTATPEQVREMMETVTNLQQTIDDRKAAIDDVIELDE